MPRITIRTIRITATIIRPLPFFSPPSEGPTIGAVAAGGGGGGTSPAIGLSPAVIEGSGVGAGGGGETAEGLAAPPPIGFCPAGAAVSGATGGGATGAAGWGLGLGAVLLSIG